MTETTLPGSIGNAEVYQANLAFMETHLPELRALTSLAPPRLSRLEKARNGLLTLSYKREDTPIYLHSRFNPELESAKLLVNKDLGADHIVVYGLGLGYLLEKVMELKDPLSRVLLIEPELEILHQSMYRMPWFKWFKRKDLMYVFGRDQRVLVNALHNFINIASFDKLEFIELPSETRLLHEFFDGVRATFDDELKANLYDFKTRLAENVAVPRNVLKNLPLLLKSKPITRLKDAFNGVPGFIVSAGPSLDRNILHLKKIADRGLIIAVDTALKPLLARDIQPHFTTVGDPSHKNYLHIQGTEQLLRHFMVAEAGVTDRIFRNFAGRTFSLSIGKAIVRMLENHMEPLGEVEAWGSVISIALDFAVFTGMDPIVLVGQDFAFSDSRNHCRGTSWEEKNMEYSRDLDQLQRSEAQAIAGNRKVMAVNDIYGRKTFTSERLSLYKTYLARLTTKYPQSRFFNGTEGGIFTEIPQITLKEALKRFVYHRPPVDLNGLHHLPALDRGENISGLKMFLTEKHVFFNEFHQLLVEAVGLLEKCLHLNAAAMVAAMEHAEQLQGLLYGVRENGELMEMWSAAPIYHFMKEYRAARNMELNDATLRKNLEIFLDYFRNIKPLAKDMAVRFGKAALAVG